MNADQVPGIRPPFKLYELHAQASFMNSPPEPAVVLYSRDVVDGQLLGQSDALAPDQARAYGRRICAAADEAEGLPSRVDAAIEAAARAYYGCQSIEYPGDEDLQRRFMESWDSGRVRPEIMARCRVIVTPLVVAVLRSVEGRGDDPGAPPIGR